MSPVPARHSVTDIAPATAWTMIRTPSVPRARPIPAQPTRALPENIKFPPVRDINWWPGRPTVKSCRPPLRHGRHESRSRRRTPGALRPDPRRHGDADLEHIRTVTAYGQAINARRLELLHSGGLAARVAPRSWKCSTACCSSPNSATTSCTAATTTCPGRGVPPDRYQWDFNVDTAQWKVMHHEGHPPAHQHRRQGLRPRYSVLRAQPAQDWFGHHAVQVALLGAVFPPCPSWRRSSSRTSPEG